METPYSLVEIAAAGVVWFIVDQWFYRSKIGIPKDLNVSRLERQMKNTNGGNPRMINKLKNILISNGNTPSISDSSNPQKIEAELTHQVMNLKKDLVENMTSTNLLVLRDKSSAGARINDLQNFRHPRDTLKGRSELDGES